MEFFSAIGNQKIFFCQIHLRFIVSFRTKFVFRLAYFTMASFLSHHAKKLCTVTGYPCFDFDFVTIGGNFEYSAGIKIQNYNA